MPPNAGSKKLAMNAMILPIILRFGDKTFAPAPPRRARQAVALLGLTCSAGFVRAATADVAAMVRRHKEDDRIMLSCDGYC